MNLRTRFSKLIFCLLVIGCASVVTLGFRKVALPKFYTVTLSLDQWQHILTSVDSTNKIILDSDIPTRKTVYATSALSFLTQTIQMQVGQQLQNEQKVDTTKPKTPKK